jgi:hypothetical protein
VSQIIIDAFVACAVCLVVSEDMSQIPDTQSSTKKRRIEDVLGEKSDLTDRLDTSMASESVVVDATQFKDEHLATTSGTKDTGNLPEVEVHAEDDHLAKKC